MYNGWLIKVGGYQIPHKLIKAETYQVTRYTQDLDSYTDADGKLHREVVDYVADKVEFEIPALKTNAEISAFFDTLFANYIDKRERKATVTLYVPEINKYVTQDMYLANPTFQIYYADAKIIKYNAIRIAFTSYGVKESL